MTQSPQTQVRPRFNERSNIFDGFAYRQWDADIDGWMNEMPDELEYPSVQAARDTLAMWGELQEAKRRIWELKREVARHKSSSAFGS